MVLQKPLEPSLPNEQTSTDPAANGPAKKSSNITAMTSINRSSELQSPRKISRDQTTLSTATETSPGKERS